jgi:hypothetical protein
MMRIYLFFLVVFFISCGKENDLPDPGDAVLQLKYPTGFPAPSIPEDNQPTVNRIRLGEKLFF